MIANDERNLLPCLPAQTAAGPDAVVLREVCPRTPARIESAHRVFVLAQRIRFTD